jgi:hypothetical protein
MAQPPAIDAGGEAARQASPWRQFARIEVAEEIGDDDVGAGASRRRGKGPTRQGGYEDRHAMAPAQPAPTISRAAR